MSKVGWPDTLDRLGIRSLVRPIVAIMALLFLLVLSTLLPGTDEDLRAVPISVDELVIALLTIALVLLFLQVATGIRAMIHHHWEHTSAIALPTAEVVQWSIVYVAVIIAYHGLRGLALSIAAETILIWVYDIGFFALGLFLLLLIGFHLYRLLDPLANRLTAKFQSTSVANSDTIQSTLPVESSRERDHLPNKRW